MRFASSSRGRGRRSGPTSAPRPGAPTKPRSLSALWDLVWAGEITNDTFGPLRAPRRASAKRSTRARPHPGRLTRLGPPAGAGRWSLVANLLEPRPTPTEIARRDRAATPRSLRRGHARGGAGRGDAGRVRRRLPGAARARRGRARPPGMVRRRPRRRAVRIAGRGRPLARGSEPAGRRAGPGRRARGDRSGAALRRRARAGPSLPAATGRHARPARTSCWSTAPVSRTSSAAGARS